MKGGECTRANFGAVKIFDAKKSKLLECFPVCDQH